VEILSTKAVGGFQDAGYEVAQARRYACFSFFAGLMATWLMGKAVSLIGRAGSAWRNNRVSTLSSSKCGSLQSAAGYRANNDACIEEHKDPESVCADERPPIFPVEPQGEVLAKERQQQAWVGAATLKQMSEAASCACWTRSP
jgi:hypothetical protein